MLPPQWRLLVFVVLLGEVASMKVRDSLRYGKENAIPSKALAEALGFRTVRDLQKAIEAERAAGNSFGSVWSWLLPEQ